MAPGETSLTALIKAVNAATGNEIRIPAYAGGRRLLVYGSQAPAGDLVMGIEDLYGWTLQFSSGRKYALGRPRPSAAGDATDLHRKIRAALPPAFHHLRSGRVDFAAGKASVRLMTRLFAEIARRKGTEWKTLPVRELDAAAEQMLANAQFGSYVLGPAESYIRNEAPPRYLTAPQEAYFLLEGETGPGKHPTLSFRAGRAPGRIEGWGWIVGTSSLD